jgi:hypothetical protein
VLKEEKEEEKEEEEKERGTTTRGWVKGKRAGAGLVQDDIIGMTNITNLRVNRNKASVSYFYFTSSRSA